MTTKSIKPSAMKPCRMVLRIATGISLAFAVAACGGGSDSGAEDSTHGTGKYGQVTLLESSSTSTNFIPCTVAVKGDVDSGIQLDYRCGDDTGPQLELLIDEYENKASRVLYANVTRQNVTTEPDPKYKFYVVNTDKTPDDKVVIDAENRTVTLKGVEVSLWVYDGYGKMTLAQITADKVKIDGTLNY